MSYVSTGRTQSSLGPKPLTSRARLAYDAGELLKAARGWHTERHPVRSSLHGLGHFDFIMLAELYPVLSVLVRDILGPRNVINHIKEFSPGVREPVVTGLRALWSELGELDQEEDDEIGTTWKRIEALLYRVQALTGMFEISLAELGRSSELHLKLADKLHGVRLKTGALTQDTVARKKLEAWLRDPLLGLGTPSQWESFIKKMMLLESHELTALSPLDERALRDGRAILRRSLLRHSALDTYMKVDQKLSALERSAREHYHEGFSKRKTANCLPAPRRGEKPVMVWDSGLVVCSRRDGKKEAFVDADVPNTRDRCGFVALCTVAKNFSPWWFHTKSFTPAGAVLNALEFIGKNPRYLELEDDAHLDAEPDDVELRYILDLLKKAASKRQEQPRPQTVGSSPAANSVFALLETLYFDGDGLTPEDAALIAALAGADLQTYVEPSDLGGQPTLSRGFYRPSSSRQPPVVLNLMEPSDHSHYSPLLRARPQHPDKRITQAQRVQIFTIEGRRYRRDSVVGDGFCGFTALNQAAAQQSMTFTIGAVGGYEINASSFVLAIQTFLPSGSGLWSILEHIEAAASNAAASGVGSEATATNLVHAAQTLLLTWCHHLLRCPQMMPNYSMPSIKQSLLLVIVQLHREFKIGCRLFLAPRFGLVFLR